MGTPRLGLVLGGGGVWLVVVSGLEISFGFGGYPSPTPDCNHNPTCQGVYGAVVATRVGICNLFFCFFCF